MLIYRLVQIMFLFVDFDFGFFLKLGRLLGFESLFWHGNGSWGGRNDLSQDLGRYCVRFGGEGGFRLITQ